MRVKTVLLLFILSMTLVSCEFSVHVGTLDDKRNTSDKVSTNLKEDITNQVLKSISSSDQYPPFDSLHVIADELSNMEDIIEVYFNNIAFVITYKDSSTQSWDFPPPLVDLPPVIQNRNAPPPVIGNNKILLIQGSTTDFMYKKNQEVSWGKKVNQVFQEITPILEANGFEVDIINNENANIDFLTNHLHEYGAIFFGFHGFYYDGLFKDYFAFTLGEHWDEDKHKNIKYIYKSDVIEYHNGVEQTVSYVCVKNKFIKNILKDNNLSNSLVYMASCQGLKGDAMANDFIKRGAKAIVGWDESNACGHHTGNLFYRFLNSGYNVGESFDLLPDSYMHSKGVDINGVEYDAYLNVFDKSAKDLLLTEIPYKIQVEITNVNNNDKVTSRNFTIKGELSGIDTDIAVTAIVNLKSAIGFA